MKILHLIYTNGVAGAEKYLVHLLPPMRKLGFNCHLVIVCAPGAEGNLKNYCNILLEKQVPVKLIITSRNFFFNTARSINNYLKEQNIKIIHSHLLNSDLLATMVKVFFNKDIILISTKHGYKESIQKRINGSLNIKSLKNVARRDMYYHITKYVVKKTDYNYAVSNAIGMFYYDLGLSSQTMPFIHHGIAIEETKINETGEFRFSNHQLVVVGRLEAIKGHKYLLQAMPMVIEHFPECKLLIIGEGAEKQNLHQLVSKLNIEKNIDFLGFKSDPYSYVKNSDVAVLPFFFESFGLVYIEAFALGTPIVAFDTAAGNEIMTHNETSLLVSPGDVKELAMQIINILQNPQLAKSLSEAAKRRYTENFSTERMVNETADFYKKIQQEKMVSQ